MLVLDEFEFLVHFLPGRRLLLLVADGDVQDVDAVVDFIVQFFAFLFRFVLQFQFLLQLDVLGVDFLDYLQQVLHLKRQFISLLL